MRTSKKLFPSYLPLKMFRIFRTDGVYVVEASLSSSQFNHEQVLLLKPLNHCFVHLEMPVVR